MAGGEVHQRIGPRRRPAPLRRGGAIAQVVLLVVVEVVDRRARLRFLGRGRERTHVHAVVLAALHQVDVAQPAGRRLGGGDHVVQQGEVGGRILDHLLGVGRAPAVEQVGDAGERLQRAPQRVAVGHVGRHAGHARHPRAGRLDRAGRFGVGGRPARQAVHPPLGAPRPARAPGRCPPRRCSRRSVPYAGPASPTRRRWTNQGRLGSQSHYRTVRRETGFVELDAEGRSGACDTPSHVSR